MQHDFVIDNQEFPNFRADLNNALEAIASNNSSDVAPANPYPGQIWVKSNTNEVYIRSQDNTVWQLLTSYLNVPVLQAGKVAESQIDSTIARDSELQAGLDTKAAVVHSHAIADVTGLQTALNGKENAGVAASLDASHIAAADPHTQYALESSLGTMAPQNSNNISVTGGTISGLSSFTVGAAPGASFFVSSPGATGHLAMELRAAGTSSLVYQDWTLGNTNDYDARLSLKSLTDFSFEGLSSNLVFNFNRPIGLFASNGNAAQIQLRTNTLSRWVLAKTATSEAGSNAGSDFALHRYDDAGTLLSSPFAITRSSSLITFNGGLTVDAWGSLQTVGIGRGSVVGNARGTGATDLQVIRTAATQVASGNYSFALGQNNTASGESSISIGSGNVASGSNSFSIGGSCTASGGTSVAIGNGNISSGANSVTLNASNLATNNCSIAFGFRAKSRRFAELAIAGGMFAATGDAQTTFNTFRSITTTATPIAAYNFGNSLFAVDLNNVSLVDVKVVAKEDASSPAQIAAWSYQLCIYKGATNASLTIVGDPVQTVIGKTSQATDWDFYVEANASTGNLDFMCKGATGKTISWSLTITCTELIKA